MLNKAKNKHGSSNNIFIKLVNRKYTGFIIPTIIFLLTFIIYVKNLSPTVFGGDSGDFLTAILTNGVPHPSGYPLYTMIGILFNNFPLGHTSAWRVGLSSALFASLTVVF